MAFFDKFKCSLKNRPTHKSVAKTEHENSTNVTVYKQQINTHCFVEFVMPILKQYSLNADLSPSHDHQ